MPQISTRTEYDTTQALNYSLAKAILVSPAHGKAYLESPREQTPALRLGSAIHCSVLQPELYAQTYATAPEGLDRRTKAGKEAYEAFSAANVGKTILSADEAALTEDVTIAATALLARHGVLIEKAEVMYAVEYCGVPLKSAIDLVAKDGYLWDLKTCEDASPRGALNALRSYRYNLQAHFYRTVYEIATKERPLGFRFAFVEKKPPYATAVYEIGPELMSYAVADFEKAVTLYKSCTALDEWPGYPTEVQVLDINAPATAASTITFA